jgi:hypothetical protein
MRAAARRRPRDCAQEDRAARESAIDGAVDLAPIRGHALPLSEGLRGFEQILKGEALKPVLAPD